jgi:predicted nucleic-acid-binding protein
LGGREVIIPDTNLLLRAVINDEPKQSDIARKEFSRAEKIGLSLHAICEFVWVLSRSYKIAPSVIASSLRELLSDSRISCNRPAVESGLSFLDNGGDFADGVIEFEGRILGGETFVTFDKRAASIVEKQGRKAVLLASD